MTPRMTVALAVLAVGLAVSALAGVPLLAADAVAAPAFWWGGLGVALAGLVVALTAIPGQRRVNRGIKYAERVGTFQIENERERLLRKQEHVGERMRLATVEFRRVAKGEDADKSNGSDAAYLEVLKAWSDLDDVMALLDDNAAEYFKATGRMPYEDIDDPRKAHKRLINGDDEPEPDDPDAPSGNLESLRAALRDSKRAKPDGAAKPAPGEPEASASPA